MLAGQLSQKNCIKENATFFQDFQGGTSHPCLTQSPPLFFKLQNERYQKLVLEKKMRKWRHLSGFPIYILTMNQEWTIVSSFSADSSS